MGATVRTRRVLGIEVRLGLATLVVAAVVLGAAGLVEFRLRCARGLGRLEAQAGARAERLAVRLAGPLGRTDAARLGALLTAELAAELEHEPAEAVAVRGAAGRVLAAAGQARDDGQVAARRPVAGSGGAEVEVRLGTAPILAELRGLAWSLALLLVVLELALLAAVVLTTRLVLVRPLRELARTADAIAAGDLSRQIVPRGGDVLEDLARALAAMVGTLEERLAEVERAEHAATASRNHLDAILNAVGDPLFVKDERHRLVLVNDAYCAFTGRSREQVLGRTDHDLHAPEQAAVYLAKDRLVLSSGAPHVNEEEVTGAGGARLVVATKKALYRSPRGERFVVGVMRDVTEQKALEAQLRHALKMETLGRLASGVAHDFNNLLTPILGYADLLLKEAPADDRGRPAYQSIFQAAQRAKELTERLLGFGRKQVLEPRPLDPGQVLRRFQGILRRTIREDVDMQFEVDPACGAVRGDPGQLEQILVNLCVNAQDAMPGGGVLRVSVRRLEVEGTRATRLGDLAPGAYAVLEVQDTGAGMDEATQLRIFEPFFTTKASGRGTGLGLSTVYGIVQQHGGAITVDSTPGRGSTFRVWLPSLPGAQAMPAAVAHAPPVVLPRGAETVLVVEDDAMARRLTCDMLTSLGYAALPAVGGDHALEVAAQHPGPLHLVVSDAVMPGMSGPQLFSALQRRRPGVRFLLASGHADPPATGNGAAAPGLVRKPFTLRELAESVRAALDGRRLAAE